jgi:hypothetical protein
MSRNGHSVIRHLLAAATIAATTAIGTAPAASADPMSDLIGMLPPGYAPESCHGSTNAPSKTLASLDCSEVTGIVPGGRYQIFGDLNALHRQFEVDFDPRLGSDWFKPLNCPEPPV